MNGYLSLGSNLGNRLNYLIAALDALNNHGVKILKNSSIYETKASEVDMSQPRYLNIVLRISTKASPFELLDICHKLEKSLGRKRPYKHSPRTIDIDILMLDDIYLNTPSLIVPHPRMELRAFVIYPLYEIAPELILPSGKHILEVKKTFDNAEILAIWKIQDEDLKQQKKKDYSS
ncbi:MAG: 2-amino-4-hydroxy-6-hydroxymethyldihydropteridine diphosphokinase [Deltaproteobacteria bacterium]|nr:2-amino-4-hydroxy-6-hydroxymethyldihydropteridine diphosphokinase [Deltaproteobacteria bacterium]